MATRYQTTPHVLECAIVILLGVEYLLHVLCLLSVRPPFAAPVRPSINQQHQLRGAPPRAGDVPFAVALPNPHEPAVESRNKVTCNTRRDDACPQEFSSPLHDYKVKRRGSQRHGPATGKQNLVRRIVDVSGASWPYRPWPCDVSQRRPVARIERAVTLKPAEAIAVYGADERDWLERNSREHTALTLKPVPSPRPFSGRRVVDRPDALRVAVTKNTPVSTVSVAMRVIVRRISPPSLFPGSARRQGFAQPSRLRNIGAPTRH